MTNKIPTSAPLSRKRMFIGGTCVIIAAAIIMLVFVLPAEYGIDPTGIGRKAGLVRIADPGTTTELERGARRKGVLTLSDSAPAEEDGNRDDWNFELGPYESVEFKYTIREGQRIAFTWKSTEPVYYDMHAHPFEGGVDLTESYGVGNAALMHGRYIAPFTGIHGWYWQNRSLDPVTLTLKATGGFSASTIFDATGEHDRPIGPAAE